MYSWCLHRTLEERPLKEKPIKMNFTQICFCQNTQLVKMVGCKPQTSRKHSKSHFWQEVGTWDVFLIRKWEPGADAALMRGAHGNESRNGCSIHLSLGRCKSKPHGANARIHTQIPTHSYVNVKQPSHFRGDSLVVYVKQLNIYLPCAPGKFAFMQKACTQFSKLETTKTPFYMLVVQ